MGVLIVIVSGGIDVSFMAIGIFAGYTVVSWQHDRHRGGQRLSGFGSRGHRSRSRLVNALAIAGLRLPTLIATLGTAGIFRGVMLAFIGRQGPPRLSAGPQALSTSYLVTDHAAPHPPLGPDHPVHPDLHRRRLILRYTLVGRGIFAHGGDAESARRAGFPSSASR